MKGSGFKTLYRLPERLGGGEFMGGPVGGDDAVTLMVPGVGLVRMPVEALEIVTADERPGVAADMPELLRRVATQMREEVRQEEDKDEFDESGLHIARMFEIAADRWDDRRYRGDRLLGAVGDLGLLFGEVICEPPLRLAEQLDKPKVAAR